jgi:hypothetical protein
MQVAHGSIRRCERMAAIGGELVGRDWLPWAIASTESYVLISMILARWSFVNRKRGYSK